MAKYVPDINTQRWVVITPSRFSRPDEIKVIANLPLEQKTACAFCEGNEKMTPPEVWRIGGEGLWNQPGWRVRVIPNKYTITDVHEVIIHSPDHAKDIEDLSIDHVQLILQVYRQRFQAHREAGHVIIFCNHGIEAGASLKHPHSQLVVLPKQITLDTLEREPLNNLVEENTYFSVFCPDFSQWPYEVWIAPKENEGSGLGNFKTVNFSQITDTEISDLAKILHNTLIKLKTIAESPKMKKIIKDPEFAYNYYIYHGDGWYIRIIPRFIHRAGFELGTGLSVNIIDPSDAADEIKEVTLK